MPDVGSVGEDVYCRNVVFERHGWASNAWSVSWCALSAAGVLTAFFDIIVHLFRELD